MTKTIKRLILFLIVLFTPVVFISAEENDVTDIGVAKYYTETVLEEKTLRNNVLHYKHLGATSAIAGEITDMGMGVTEAFVPDKYYGQQVNILDVPSTSGASLVPWAFIKDSAWNLENVGKIAKDYENKHPGEKVIAAVNGDFYDISGGKMYPYAPNSIHAANGDIFKSVHRSYNNAVGFLNDGSNTPLVGNKKIVRNENPTLAIFDSEGLKIKEFTINKVNEEPQENEIAVLYPRYGVEVHGKPPQSIPINVNDAYIVHGEYSIPYTEVSGVYGYESDNLDFFGKGHIYDFGSGTLGKNDFAVKTTNQEVLNYLEAGVKIRVQYEFQEDFKEVENIIGYNQPILYNNEKVGTNKQRAPRTMVGVKEDGSYILGVIDGRQPNKDMYGAGSAEMAAVLTHYGAVEAYNLDGGGSSAMVVLDDETNTFNVVNSYSDSGERRVSNALLVVVKNPILEVVPKVTSTSINLEIDFIKDNGFILEDLYVEVAKERKQIINNEVSFNDLDKAKKYSYEIYHKVNDKYVPLHIKGEFKTGLNPLSIDKVDIYYSGNDLIFEVEIKDPDNVFQSGKISLDNTDVEIINGMAIFRRFKGSNFDSFIPSITYNLDNYEGLQTKRFYEFDLVTNADVLIDYSLNKFINFYKDSNKGE